MIKNIPQIHAANPNISVWVNASAGTGKTKILTDRVLRLLLNKVTPGKILCLTFTKAAAGEMENRLNSKLASWQYLSDIELESELTALLDKAPTKEQLQNAKNLLYKKIDKSETIKIKTIHSFCQSILQKFPIEAAIEPNFKTIDEYKIIELINIIKREILQQIQKEPESKLAESLEFLVTNLHENTVFEAVSEIIFDRDNFLYLTSHFANSDQYDLYLRQIFNLSFDDNRQKLIEFFVKKFLDKGIIYTETQTASKTDLIKIEQLNNLAQLKVESQIRNFANLKELFFTKDNQLRKKLFSKKFTEENEAYVNIILNIAEKLAELQEKLNSLNIIYFSKHLFNLGKVVIDKFTILKKQYGFLDYNDLITKTAELFTDSDLKFWVLYKLDENIDHILVDEAQDTSINQWQIIQAILEEYYSGQRENTQSRSLFVVGDIKQSIYSFQGARPDYFIAKNLEMAENFQAANLNFKNINLQISYRSTEAILQFVNQVFQNIKLNKNIDLTQNILLEAHREKQYGKVEILPIVKKIDSKPEDEWPIYSEKLKIVSAMENMAELLSNKIAALLKSGKFIISRNRKIQAGDILILVRKRNEFTKILVEKLKAKNILVAGIDRINLKNYLAIKDLIAILQFAVTPFDDLNLAALLKSSLFNLDEESLYQICAKRKKQTIYQILQEFAYQEKEHNIAAAKYSPILEKLELLKQQLTAKTLTNFFIWLLDIYGYRKLFVTEFGEEVNDILDEFIYLLKDFEQNQSSDINIFLNWFNNNEFEVKRDLEASHAVRIMTVHGAKGLQAPIVILADQTDNSSISDRFIFDEKGLLLWPGKQDYVNHYFKEQKDKIQHSLYAEYLRLLYVAITRAEDELIIAGYQNNQISEDCWYSILKQTLINIGTEQIAEEYADICLDNKAYIYDLHEAIDDSKHTAIEENIEYNFPKTNFTTQINNSELENNNNVINSFENFLYSRADRGVIIHQILELLFKTKNFQYAINLPEFKEFDKADQAEIIDNLQAFYESEFYNNIIENEYYTEYSIGKKNKVNAEIYRLDLLVIEKNIISIIDYKTDHQPTKIVPASYRLQLQKYKNLISELYPGFEIKTYILWFANLTLEEIIC